MQRTSRSMMSGGFTWWQLCEARVSCTVLRGAGGAIPPAYSPQPPVIGNPGEGALHHPTNSSWEELSVAATSDRFDGDAEFLPGLCQALAPVAGIAQRGSPEPFAG